MVYQLDYNESKYGYTHSTTTSKGRQRLPDTFQPGCYDVICARGKRAYNHEGTQRFRGLARLYQESYGETTCKYQKSKIVSKIVNTIRQYSQGGGFVKLVDGVWYEVGDRAAKEKVGQTFRDLLHTKYSSSTKAKARVRIQRRVDEYNTTCDVPKDVSFHQGRKFQNHTEVKECHASIVSEDPEENGGNSANRTDVVPNYLHEQRALTGPFCDNINIFDSFLPWDAEAKKSKRASFTIPPLSLGNDDQLLGAELVFDCASLADDTEGFFALDA